MKKVASILAALMLSLTCVTAVNADWYGSKTQNGGVEVTNKQVTSKDGKTVNVAVTPAASASGETTYVQNLVKNSDGLEGFFDLLKNGEDVKAAVSKEAGDLSNLTYVSLFDVDIDADLAEGDSVEIAVSVEGIKAKDSVVALHFYNNTDNIGVNAEVIPATVNDNGDVVLTMSSFSPVLILKNTKNNAPADGTSSSDKTQTGVYSNVALWAGVLVVAVAAAGVVLYDRKKKAN